ncbi:hypothetical protein [Legionella worsleiensis]|uniref:Uncharacterized protein n=1 Tax=Legionella worsleiensis TaxID=45076 RepID=A0A0W1A3U0_9GAMM|nr:hypothetical protein [Legionella worsleiensis]KTD76021.1 hypothetical protein Lwor_2587 [Legionella worsleiensis]STY33035.1 Uncharacterised protein [Legionella worsleiensis]
MNNDQNEKNICQERWEMGEGLCEKEQVARQMACLFAGVEGPKRAKAHDFENARALPGIFFKNTVLNQSFLPTV